MTGTVVLSVRECSHLSREGDSIIRCLEKIVTCPLTFIQPWEIRIRSNGSKQNTRSSLSIAPMRIQCLCTQREHVLSAFSTTAQKGKKKAQALFLFSYLRNLEQSHQFRSKLKIIPVPTCTLASKLIRVLPFAFAHRSRKGKGEGNEIAERLSRFTCARHRSRSDRPRRRPLVPDDRSAFEQSKGRKRTRRILH